MPEISVVIPTYNRLDTLSLVLPTLLVQDLSAAQYELLVCDSNSNDGTAEFLRDVAALHPNVRHLPGAYGGRAAARNAGIEQARGEIVLFNDADIFASPDLLSVHRSRHLQRTGIAVVGLEVQARDYEEYEYKRDHPQARGHLHPASRKRLPWLYFLTGNASVRRTDLLRAGCFDESFTGYAADPCAELRHCQDVSHDDQKEKMRLAGRSTARFYRKHSRLDVMLNLGMTPVSLGLHSFLTRFPALLASIDRRSARSRLARELILQYHYVSGIKEGRSGA